MFAKRLICRTGCGLGVVLFVENKSLPGGTRVAAEISVVLAAGVVLAGGSQLVCGGGGGGGMKNDSSSYAAVRGLQYSDSK